MMCESSIPMGKQDAHGAGSALTYAKRFALAAAVGVVADDDDDGNAASEKPKPKVDKTAPGQANTASLTPEQRVAAWVEGARRAIEGIRAAEEFALWKEANDAALAKLQANHPDKYEALLVFIEGKRDSWSTPF
jgi:hypothetical protein